MSVLVIGEALLDIVDGRRRPGGSPLNVAVGLARLGVATTLHTSLAHDDAGRLIARHLGASGVLVTPQSWTSRPTSTAEVRLDSAGNAHYTFDIGWDPAPITVAPATCHAVHLGSISAMMRPGTSAIDSVLEQTRAAALRSYDLNIRPTIVGDPDSARHRAQDLITQVDIVKASDTDVKFLYPTLVAEQVIEEWLDRGSKLAVLTRGAHGAILANARTSVTVTAPRVDLADTVGAGDSFMAGLLAALHDRGLLDPAGRDRLPTLDEDGLHELAAFAARCAAVTVTRVGADPPRRADIA